MAAATSTVIKEEHQAETCIYCGASLKGGWQFIILDGLEYKVRQCENGHEARIKISKQLTIDQFEGVHRLDWGTVTR